jgi:hypothetical protein
MRNIGPKSRAWLGEIDIRSLEDLRAVGAVEAYARLEHAVCIWKQFCRSRFSSGQSRLAKGIPQGTSEPIASDPGGKMPGPSGWLKRAA